MQGSPEPCPADGGIQGAFNICEVFHVKQSSPHILLIHPWITDFAAYNFWIRPLGLLSLASLLREYGCRVTLIDCLDHLSRRKQYGDGRFLKTKIEKPLPLKGVPRNYCQYGISEKALLERLSSVEKPDLVGITSGMTYWYPGLFKAIEIIRKAFKGVPIILGGIYATLCYEHAQKYSGAGIVFKGNGDRAVLQLMSELTHFELLTDNCKLEIDNLAYPAFDLYLHLDYACISTSKGCPFRCTYCASPYLNQGFYRKDPGKVVEEIDYWTTRYSVRDIAFYDDALLFNPSEHFIPLMREVIRKGIHCKFHTPNGLHIREINDEVAELLFRGGFKTIRLGLETADEATQMESGGKVNNKEFENAIKNLKRAGYSGEEIGVYIMVGLPGQRAEEAKASIAFVKETGARPLLTEYSPIPHTPLFEKAKEKSPFDLENEPLFHNNSIFPCQWEGFTLADYKKLKEMVKVY
jgi:radical SAM superfamily enzyme YgiQ (UPF0313 family)